jgi:hypothetical protein
MIDKLHKRRRGEVSRCVDRFGHKMIGRLPGVREDLYQLLTTSFIYIFVESNSAAEVRFLRRPFGDFSSATRDECRSYCPVTLAGWND